MVPIAIKAGQQFDAESFNNFLTRTCKLHKSEGRALAFAFIVYDFDNHTIMDILNKDSYWSALDKMSGQMLSVFYINSKDSYYKTRQEQIYQDEVQQQERNSQRGYISYPVPVTRKPTPTDNAINLIKTEFKIHDNIKPPFVLFFQIDNEGSISDSFVVGLKQDRLEDAFLELRGHIKNAVDALNDVIPECHKNHQEIFNLIKGNVESGVLQSFISKKLAPKLSIGTIISLIKLIAGPSAR